MLPQRQPPRSAYIHVPFCRHRCGYCNFSVVADRDDLTDRFIAAIDRELHTFSLQGDTPPELDTVYIGGGTPTHLPPKTLDRFLAMIRDHFTTDPSTEWTIEANPEDITDELVDLLADAGINRVSLGVQSFHDAKLQTLERGHSGSTAADAIRKVARRIENVSADLIFAAPGESLADWERDLETAISLPIRHLSTYALTFEKGTSFWSRLRRGDLNSVDESRELEMYDLARDVLASAGIPQYEISNFAPRPYRCRHNLCYWRGDSWYAAGPGAASFVGGVRRVNHRSTTTYLKRTEENLSPVAESEPISDEQLSREAAAFGVRMIDGINLADLSRRTGTDVRSLCASSLARLREQELIIMNDQHIKLTERGIHFADTVASELLG